MNEIKILAVADPAVFVYVNDVYNILGQYEESEVEIKFDIVAWEDYYSKMIDALEGNVDYDIVMVAGHLWLADLVSNNYLAPLEYEDKDILPVIMNEMNYDGRTYLSPSFCDGHMIVYRKSMIEHLTTQGMSEVIKTDDFLRIVKQLKESDCSPAVALKAHPSEIFLDALPYLRSSSTQDMYSITDGNITCHIDQMIGGLEHYIDLKSYASDQTCQYGNDEIKRVLVNREVPIATTWSGQLGEVYRADSNPKDLGFSTFETAWNVTWSFGIVNRSHKQEEAKKLLAYLRSPVVDELVGEFSGAPIRKSSYLKGQDKFPWYNIQLQMIERYAKPLIHVIGAGEYNGVLYEEIYQAFTSQKSVVDAVKDAKERIERRN